MQQDYDWILDQARVKLLGASDAGIKAELIAVMREFFDTTNAWQENIPLTLTAVTTGPSAASNVLFTISPGQGGQILRLLSIVDINGFPQPAVLIPYGAAVNPYLQPAPNLVGPQTSSPPPQLLPAQGSFRQIQFRDPYTNLPQTFTVSVVKQIITPKNIRKEMPQVPEFLFGVHGNVIEDGLLGRMMGQPKKPYSEDALSVYHLRRFRDGMAMVRTQVIRSGTYGNQNWVFPQTWKSRNQRSGVSVGIETGFGF